MNKVITITIAFLIITACKKTDSRVEFVEPPLYCTEGTKVAHCYPALFTYDYKYYYDSLDRLSQSGMCRYYYDVSGKLTRKDYCFGPYGFSVASGLLTYDSWGTIKKFEYKDLNTRNQLSLYSYSGYVLKADNYQTGIFISSDEFHLDTKGNYYLEINRDSTGKIYARKEYFFDDKPIHCSYQITNPTFLWWSMPPIPFNWFANPPFLWSKNNIIRIRFMGSTANALIKEHTYSYTYNGQGYPLEVVFRSTDVTDPDQSYRLDYFCD